MREVKVKKYKGSVILKVALFCFSCFFVFTLINQQMQISEKETQLEEIRTEREEQDIKNDELEEALETDVGMDSYAEEYARKEYNYVKLQERIFINVGGQEAEK